MRVQLLCLCGLGRQQTQTMAEVCSEVQIKVLAFTSSLEADMTIVEISSSHFTLAPIIACTKKAADNLRNCRWHATEWA